ncbi:hypothetical protein ABOM_001691 [Aspergillus bombycis]|uniref:HNH nuclease domain-containing protein n=1 Tax=Aspergillus bombycis TaxID=109264 RepID=A0A1F8ACL4_9EURO|nr:hypothetical protein ABOM_001691 [Aspergillus bombycis]OGM49474.1 hypothetical protein ABOM_001691 [Aspergillus bombycis]
MASAVSIAPELISEERSLIQRLSKVNGLREVDSATHAIPWLSDLKILRRKVEYMESDPMLRDAMTVNLGSSLLALDAVKVWLGRSKGKTESTTTNEQPAELTESTPSSETSQKTSRKRKSEGQSSSLSKLPRQTRSKPAKDTASERDNGRCVITKMGKPVHICHIYRLSLGNETESARPIFWSLLQTFWDPETIASWKRDIMGLEGTEVTQNLLCLSTMMHDLWNSARLAFEPVDMSEDKKFLTMRFWWLPHRDYSPQVSLVVPPSLPSGPKASSGNAKLWNCDTDEPIYSGQLITIRTQDPEAMPLPSFALLKMQWFLNRIAAMSGAADVTDEELEDYFGD